MKRITLKLTHDEAIIINNKLNECRLEKPTLTKRDWAIDLIVKFTIECIGDLRINGKLNVPTIDKLPNSENSIIQMSFELERNTKIIIDEVFSDYKRAMNKLFKWILLNY